MQRETQPMPLWLEPLTPDEMEELVDGLLPGVPEELSARIVERAEGVPLYASEMARMLVDRGLLERRGERYEPTEPVEDLDVPATLQALIAARLDALPACGSGGCSRTRRCSAHPSRLPAS